MPQAFAFVVIAFIVFFAAMGVVDTLVGTPIERKNQIMLKQCEADMPRNQHCIIIAIPENKKEIK